MTGNLPGTGPEPPSSSHLDPEQIRRQAFANLGIETADRAMWNLRSVLREIGEEMEPRIFEALEVASDADAALGGLERLLCSSLGFPPAILEQDRFQRLVKILGAGEPMADLAQGHLLDATSADFIESPDHIPHPPKIGGADETARARALHRWHRKEQLRIVCCELEGVLDVDQTGFALSDLADHTIRCAIDVLGGKDLAMGVVALGKWGGRELNFSSDIDLYFIRDDGTPAGPCEAVARGILRMFAGNTGSVPIYRTDLRLRPGGITGPLVPTVSQARNEFHAVAGTWERIVHIRSRAVHDATKGLPRLLAEVEHFVYQRPFDLDEIRRLQGWKEVLESSPAGQDAAELKVGWGGIRDVEYLVQFLQLLHGQVHESIRGGNVYHALKRLGVIGALTSTEAARVLDGYRFLRKVEHHRMLQHRRQSFSLPDDPSLYRALARSLGFEGSDQLKSALDGRRDRIREILDRLFHDLFRGYGDEQAGEVHVVLAFRPEPEVIERVFGGFSFRDPEKAYRLLRRLAFPRHRGLRSPRARHHLAALFPVLLDAFRSSPDPDQAVLMFVHCVETLGAPAVFYQQLTENPETCKIFVDLFGQSRYLSELLLNHPGVLDEVVDRVRTGRIASDQLLVEELRSTLDGVDDQKLIFQRLHEFRALHTVHIGILDLSGRMPHDRVLQGLSSIATAILSVIDELALKKTEQLLGSLVTDDAKGNTRHCLLALGRLGGREMGFASDVDMMVVHDGVGVTGGGHEARHFWTEHLKHVVEMLAQSGTGGPLYSVDLRLRPDGAGGALVTHLDEFQEYFLGNRSQLWEHQALVRMQPICGDSSLGDEVMEWTHQNLGRGVEPTEIVTELRQMHQRRKASGHKEGIDFRNGSGGLIDIEFLVQSLILLHQDKHPEIFKSRTRDAIAALESVQLLAGGEATTLYNAYQFLRMVENRLAMMHRASVKAISEDDASLRQLAIRIGFHATPAGKPEERLRDEIEYHTELVRNMFQRHHG